jgi:hypothetical protein
MQTFSVFALKHQPGKAQIVQANVGLLESQPFAPESQFLARNLASVFF